MSPARHPVGKEGWRELGSLHFPELMASISQVLEIELNTATVKSKSRKLTMTLIICEARGPTTLPICHLAASLAVSVLQGCACLCSEKATYLPVMSVSPKGVLVISLLKARNCHHERTHIRGMVNIANQGSAIDCPGKLELLPTVSGDTGGGH